MLSMLELICITLAINLGLNVLGVVASFLTLRTPLLEGVQISKSPTPDVFWSRLPIVGLNALIIVVLAVVGLTLGYGAFDFQWQGTLAFVAQFLFFVLLDDAWFYVWHRALHRNAYLYKKIHHIHHRAIEPFPMEYIYVHPLEWMVRAAAIPVGFGAIYLLNGSVSVHAFWAFIFWLNFHEIDIHSGLRSFLGRFTPFLATTEYHGLHHLKKSGNYASQFTFWDRILKTTIS